MSDHDRLVIRNFGPIHEADIHPRNLTIFVGPQATGKSLAAQLLYFMRWMEALWLPETLSDALPLQAVLANLSWWLGLQPDAPIYANPDTEICWYASNQQEEQKQSIRWENEQVHLNDVLDQRVQRFLTGKESAPAMESHVYIPAGRILFSFLPPALSLRLLSSIKRSWPGYLLTFYELLSDTLKLLYDVKKRDYFQKPLLDELGEEREFFRNRLAEIMKGEIRYGPQQIFLEVNEQLISVQNLASGQMEIWPFCAVIESNMLIWSAQEIFFEEPEAHLHPTAQVHVMEMIAFLVRNGVKVVLTTHSPYILYILNNFLLAHKVIAAGKSPAAKYEQTALSPEQVAAYRFTSDGQLIDIMDSEVGLIDAAELEDVAGNINADFSDLQDLLDDIDGREDEE